MRFLATLLAALLTLAATAQTKYTISGYVRDSATGETIIGATVALAGTGRSVTSNQYGYYSLSIEVGHYTLVASHVSYFAQTRPLAVSSSETINLLLQSKSAAMSEVVVYSRRRDANVRNAQMGQINLSMAQVKNIPAFLGEVDILKTIQLLPGVRNAGEGNAGFYVRGGGPDQNLILLDDAVVYNTGHLFGFFSIFNSDAIKNTALIKGGMPAQ
ncbi:MAG: TonB-dependent receptor, partial [Chitinophagaceae bacterium]